ncbi:hypothetical protein CT19431_P140022 [Cupriavidus taiwanensis]|nr:hypothetical protein CT19431_P140022 [Cupriavidus taiwanensis]
MQRAIRSAGLIRVLERASSWTDTILRRGSASYTYEAYDYARYRKFLALVITYIT